MVSARFVRRMALLGSALLLITFLLVIPDWGLGSAMDAAHRVDHTLQVIRASEQLLSTVEFAETSERGYLLTANGRYIRSYHSALSGKEPAMQTLRHLTVDNAGQQVRIGKLDVLVELRLSELSRDIALYKTAGGDGSAAAVGAGEGMRQMGEIQNLLHDIQQEEYRLLNIRATDEKAQMIRMRRMLRMGGAFLIVLLAANAAVSERDIRNLQRVEALLVTTGEERFRALANAIPQLCWMANPGGGIFWYNQRWYDFTGTNPQAMEGLGWQSVHDPAQLPAVLTGWKHSIASGAPFEMVFPLRAADGTFHTFLTRVMPLLDHGKVVRWIGTNTDISKQRKIEDALRQNHERLKMAQQVARIGTFEWDLKTGVNQRTPELDSMYGLQLGALAANQKTWLDFISPEDRPQTESHMLRAMETGTFEAEWRVTWPDGAEHWLSGRASVLKDDTGNPARVIGAIVDVTVGKHAELAILRANAELEQRVQQRTTQLEAANKELGAFAYSVSHDLRAPLRGIDGWSLALMEDYGAQLDQRAQQYLTRVRSETQRMGHLIDDMLQLSRVTRDEMKMDSVDLTVLATSITGRLREIEPERTIDFVIERGLVASGDSRLLEVALTNLFANAVKFTGTRSQALIEFGRTENHGETAFYVRDNGVGFDMAYAGTLFGAFQRLHKASEFPGTGIGLATVQRVVKKHNGRVWAEASPDHGATFYFSLGATS